MVEIENHAPPCPAVVQHHMHMRVCRIRMKGCHVLPDVGHVELALEHLGAPLLRDQDRALLRDIIGKRQHHVAGVPVARPAVPILRPDLHHLVEVGLRKGIALGAHICGEPEDRLRLAVHIGQLTRQLRRMLHTGPGDALHKRTPARCQAFQIRSARGLVPPPTAVRPMPRLARIRVSRSREGLPSLATRNRSTSACQGPIRGIG